MDKKKLYTNYVFAHTLFSYHIYTTKNIAKKN